MPLVKVKGTGQIGLNRDLSQSEMPINSWSDAKNIRFLDGYALQYLGHGEVYNTPSYAPLHVLPCNVQGNRYWVYLSNYKQFSVTNTPTGSQHTDITNPLWNGYYLDLVTESGLTLTAESGETLINGGVGNPMSWTSALLSGVPVINAADSNFPPMAWNLSNTSKFVSLPNWPSNMYCKSIRAYKNFLIALNVTKATATYPYMVKWSQPADPGGLPSTWDETDPTNLSGEFDIAEGYDVVIDGMQLRDSFIVYKENSTWRLDYVGGNYIFKSSKVFNKSGIMNRNCVTDIDGFHVVLTNNDVIIHDGSTAQSVLDKATRRWLFQNIDVDNVSKCFVFTNPFFNEVYVCFPSIGATSCDTSLVYNYKDKTVSTRQMPNINHAGYGPVDNGLTGNWAQDSQPWASDLTLWNGPDFVPSNARVIAGSSDVKLYMLDASASFDGVLPQAYLERRGITFEMPENIKLIKGIRPRITGNTGDTVLIQVGSQDDPWGNPTYCDPMTHVIGTTIANDCLVSGRYISIKFLTGTAYQWRLDSFDIEVDKTGGW